MNKFGGKTAVITGGASGIGRALAHKCGQEGMKVVIADIEEEPLDETSKDLKAVGYDTLPVKTDVSQPEAITNLAEKALASYGRVDLLFNNAGVGAGSTAWDSTLKDWNWVMNTNLWSVIHGIRTFVPIMLKQKSPGHIVNTASIAGLMRGHHSASYAVTKHAVVALSEQVQIELNRIEAPINVSVLCPSWVKTRINEGGRNRPKEMQNSTPPPPPTPERRARQKHFQEVMNKATPPEEIAEITFQGIRDKKQYIIPHPQTVKLIENRFNAILSDI